YFVKKAAPVSGVERLLDYEYTLLGEIKPSGETVVSLRILVPVTSLCPCSKKISEYGAHNQRSHVTITAHINETLWVEDIIDLVEAQASSQLYGLLKRPDEKFVTEQAYDNPKFVEDMVRDIAGQLNRDKRILKYQVECENFESIHNHSAFAVIVGK
ncbi:MAG: GTP cyclohydrolase, FolE2/MptA family, partial [Nitrosomonadales bacterium]|nr:GTP cyclohydrolase, FolE2/MptA family [Nitrosomonadales bacterium]